MTTPHHSATPGHDDDIVVPRRRPLRWIGIAIALFVASQIAFSFVTNPNYHWDIVGRYLFDPRILSGLGTTLLLTLIGMVLALALGLVLAIMRLSPSRSLNAAAGAYVWFFRGTPVLVQLIIWYNLAILIPELGIGVPFGGPMLVSLPTNDVITPWSAAILGLALNEAAYLCEIIRSGIISVDRGQTEASSALGMSRALTLRRIVLPQALRVIVPPASNEAIGLLKYSSVVSVIALPELLYSGQLIYGRTYETIPVLIVVCIWYLVIVSILTYLESRLERRLGVGFAVHRDTTKTRRWVRWLSPNH